MFLNNLKFLERTKLKFASKVFPVKRTEILLLDKIEIDLNEAKINQINIPSISFPHITSDLCPLKPELIELKTAPSYVQIITCQNTQCLQMLRIKIDEQSIWEQLKIICPICHHTFIYSPTKEDYIEDFTTWLKEQLFYPEIESYSMLLDLPRKTGKSYSKIEVENRQASLFDIEKGDKNCIHGLKKKWCSICIGKERGDKVSVFCEHLSVCGVEVMWEPKPLSAGLHLC